jgi:hypothetical protein
LVKTTIKKYLPQLACRILSPTAVTASNLAKLRSFHIFSVAYDDDDDDDDNDNDSV